MARTVIADGETRDERLDMAGRDKLQVFGAFSVSDEDETVRFTDEIDGARIVNEGLIENAAEEGRAIRFEEETGETLHAEIVNRGVIASVDDAVQIDNGDLVSGELLIVNEKDGEIRSAEGQALDLADARGDFLSRIETAGLIASGENDGVKIGGVGRLTNSGEIRGGADGAYADGADGVSFEDDATGRVVNAGLVSGDRHGVDAGEGSEIEVVNRKGGVLIGANGSGVGSDGSATVINHGTITGAFSDSEGSDTNGSQVGEEDGGGPDGINDGDGDGVDVDFEADIVNYGVIRGAGAGGTGSDGLPNTSEGVAAGGGEIVNHEGARIVGADLGVLIDDSSQGGAQFATRIENHGDVVGRNGFAIRIVGDQDDVLINGGRISGGDGVAVDLGGGDDRLAILDGSRIVGLAEGGEGVDLLDYRGSSKGVAVRLETSEAAGTDGVAGFENVRGSARADSIAGDDADNRLHGGAGDDKLTGHGGQDTLVGGAGDDVFRFLDASGADGDVVRDFGEGADRISLGAAFGLDKGVLDRDAFTVGAEARDAEDRVIYDRKSGDLLFDVDGEGGADAVRIAALEAGLKLGHDDVFVA